MRPRRSILHNLVDLEAEEVLIKIILIVEAEEVDSVEVKEELIMVNL